jgi:hypothetical protein
MTASYPWSFSHYGLADSESKTRADYFPFYSVGAFISLGKCHQIRRIDLYCMFQHFRFEEVLRPFRKLEHLSALAFPPNTDFRLLLDVVDIPWPPNLQETTISRHSFRRSHLLWEHFISAWPASLQSVIVDSDFTIQMLREGDLVASGGCT